MRPQRWQPTRFPRSWDSPGKNTGVGCHFLLQCMKVKSESEVAQSYLTLSNPMDCSLPGSSIHGIFQARVLEWGAIAFSGYLWHFDAIIHFTGNLRMIFLHPLKLDRSSAECPRMFLMKRCMSLWLWDNWIVTILYYYYYFFLFFRFARRNSLLVPDLQSSLQNSFSILPHSHFNASGEFFHMTSLQSIFWESFKSYRFSSHTLKNM